MEILDLNEDNDMDYKYDPEELESIADTHELEGSGGDKDDNKDKEEPSKEKKKKGVLNELLSWVMTFVIAITAALVIKNYVIINANVPTGSMENTIMPGDDLIGFRLAYTFSDPKRGDIIIFNAPDEPDQKYIKRVIGLPGETVTIENAKVYIDGELLEEDYLKEEEWVNWNDGYKFEVPEDSYLVLGDNRNGSKDARLWNNKYVHKDAIIGKAFIRWYPFDRFGKIE